MRTGAETLKWVSYGTPDTPFVVANIGEHCYVKTWKSSSGEWWGESTAKPTEFRLKAKTLAGAKAEVIRRLHSDLLAEAEAVAAVMGL